MYSQLAICTYYTIHAGKATSMQEKQFLSCISIATVSISRLTVVSREAKEEAASGALMDSRLTRMSIIQVQEL